MAFLCNNHKKLPCEEIGGTTKQLVARASLQLQATKNYQSLTLYHMFQWADQNIAKKNFFLHG